MVLGSVAQSETPVITLVKVNAVGVRRSVINDFVFQIDVIIGVYMRTSGVSALSHDQLLDTSEEKQWNHDDETHDWNTTEQRELSVGWMGPQKMGDYNMNAWPH